MSKREIDEIPRKVETKDFSEIRDEELINVIGGKMRTKEVIEIIKKTLTKCFIPCGMRFRHYAGTKETIFTSPELCIKLIEEPNNNYYTIEYDVCYEKIFSDLVKILKDWSK